MSSSAGGERPDVLAHILRTTARLTLTAPAKLAAVLAGAFRALPLLNTPSRAMQSTRSKFVQSCRFHARVPYLINLEVPYPFTPANKGDSTTASGALPAPNPLRVFGLFGPAALSCTFLVPFSLTRTKCSPRQRSSGGSWQRPGIGAPAEGPGCPLGGYTRWRAAWTLARGGR